MDKSPVKVFISYSHDGPAHEERVLELAERLREDGIHAELDQYNPSPPEGWPTWCERQIKAADFVLMVCTETYHRRARGGEEPGKGLGVVWEAQIIHQLVYDSGAVSSKFIPILFSDGSAEHIPLQVKKWTRYVVDTKEGYDALYRHLTNQPWVKPAPPGPPRTMPTRPPRPPGGSKPGGAAMTAVTPKLCANWAKLLNREDQEIEIAQHLDRMRQKSGRLDPVLVVIPGCASDCHEDFVDRVGWYDLRPYCALPPRSADPGWRAQAADVFHLLHGLREQLDFLAARDIAALEDRLREVRQSICFSFRVDSADWRTNGALVRDWVDYFCHQWPAPVRDDIVVVSFLCVELPERCGGLARLLDKLGQWKPGSLAAYLGQLKARSASEPRLLVTSRLGPIRRKQVTDWIGKVRPHLPDPDQVDKLRDRCRGLFPQPNASRPFADVHREIRTILDEVTGAGHASGLFAR